MTAPLPLPPLPEPARSRWQPLRIGLVELYHYDCEEFWFRDGHLLLRGNNGTGKSKVLSLTLPFLLDAHLSAARVEPDSDRGKRMDWNLLMGRHERRTGYAWIEFGRRDEAGDPRYLTLGCGLSALAGRPRVETWQFLTEQRVGRDLWLVSPERVVLSRERLAERLEGCGQMCDTAQEYRRAVDERLFRLGEERYRALMDTLIQLRQPQLSRQPNEHKLSDALTDALPPLPSATLEDVAEAMTQLDEYRHELTEFEAVRSAIAQFDRRYRLYARVQARRQARSLRQTQTEFDNASRTLNEARSELETAQAEVARSEARHTKLDLQIDCDRAALDELRRDPVMQDAHRLRDAEREAEERVDDARQAGERQSDAERRWKEEAAASARRQEEAIQALARLTRFARKAETCAADVGLGGEHDKAYAPLVPLEMLGEREAADLDKLDSALRGALQRRREHIAQVRRRMRDLDKATAVRDRAADARSIHFTALEDAQARARGADHEVRRAAETLVRQWRDFLLRVTTFEIADAEEALDGLSAWVESLAGDNPMQVALARAQQETLLRFAGKEAALKQQEGVLRGEAVELATEQDRLAKGEDRAPPTLHTRTPEARRDRPGAPLWRLLEFAHHVDDGARAGLEAALEAAGLLDAWVTPEGVLLDPDTQDAILTQRTAHAPSLRDWLVPADHSAVRAEKIECLLAAIACAPEDPLEVEAWVSPHGRFRIGPAQGAWMKPAAQYIGFAAREAARHRRIEEIAVQLRELASLLTSVEIEMHKLAEQRQRLIEECARAPADDALRDTQARLGAAESQRREAQERFDEAEVRLHEAERAWARGLEALEQDARDLRVPSDVDALAEFESKLVDYGDAALSLVQAGRDCRGALSEVGQQEHREREAEALTESLYEEYVRRLRTTENAVARRDLIREMTGAAVTALEQRLAQAEKAVVAGNEQLRQESESLTQARERRARAEQKMEDAGQTLSDRERRRQDAVERLHAFAGSGLLSVAVLEIEIPDPTSAWTIDPALQLARRIEQALADVPADDSDWTRVQSEISRDFAQLMQAMSLRNHQALAEQSDYGLIVQIVYQNRPERPDVLQRRLEAEIAQRREILTAREREVLENHLQAEVAAGLQKLLQDAEHWLQTINKELNGRSTSTGVRFRLEWQALPEGEEGAPVGLAAARTRLLNRSPDAWSADDRRLVGEFLQSRIQTERSRDDGGSLLEHLSRALDYRRWHRFRVKRFQDGAWRPLSGPASSGERALGLTVPLFAAASSHYASAEYPYAPRLVLLDEAFAGIDDEARAQCMALMREFDLDFVMTSEREWGCYAELPGLSICHLVRREGVDAVYVSRWNWDGRTRREEPDPSRRFPEAVASAT